MNTTERRDLLTTFPNTENKLDYVVTLIDEIGTTPESKPAIVHLRYVPDKAVVDEVSFRRYLNALAKTDWQTFEELAALILHDFNNEIVARWTQVTVSIRPHRNGLSLGIPSPSKTASPIGTTRTYCPGFNPKFII
jgi:NADPH-dependent 7-cyano-7-deazaguanine reductase QueF